MGLADRDYYRDSWEGRGGTRAWGATGWLIAVAVAAFLVQTVLESGRATPAVGPVHDWWDQHLLLRPVRVMRGEIWQLWTALFCHASFMHILFNMVVLMWAGKRLENLYGSSRFLRLYLASGFIASLADVGGSYLTHTQNIPALGASGAIMGVVVVFAFNYPRHEVLFFGFLPLEVRWVAVIYILGDIWGFAVTQNRGGVGNLAHLGGAAYGVFFWRILKQGIKWPRLSAFLPRRKRFRPVDPPADGVEPAVRREVDRLLAKISQDGLQSLSAEEREFLEKASRKYK